MSKYYTYEAEADIEVSHQGYDYLITYRLKVGVQEPWGNAYTAPSSDDYYGYSEVLAVAIDNVDIWDEDGNLCTTCALPKEVEEEAERLLDLIDIDELTTEDD